MDKPGKKEEIQLVAILRTLKKTDDEVADFLKFRKERVVFIENWLKTESLESVEAIIDNYHIKQVVKNSLVKRFEEEELEEEGERHVECRPSAIMGHKRGYENCTVVGGVSSV